MNIAMSFLLPAFAMALAPLAQGQSRAATARA